MSLRSKILPAVLLAAAVLAAPAAQAHLMVAQHGTLNLVGDGAFMVMSLPVSAFAGVDDNGDGRLDGAELHAHQAAIEAAVRSGLQLSDGHGPLPLQGLLLSLSPPDDAPDAARAPATQLVVMGRFALGPQADEDSLQELHWAMRLFGRAADEQAMSLTVTRATETQLLQLTPASPPRRLLPQGWHAWTAEAAEALAAPSRRLVVPALLLLAAVVGLWRLLGFIRTRQRTPRPAL